MSDEKSNTENSKDDNVVFIGMKPFMNYVTSVVMQFTTRNRSEVVIKARGKHINRAVDVVEIIRKKFLRDREIRIKNISIDSEEMENKEGRMTNVSTIEITIVKK
ncbi:DNA-binding protein Alba [Candidatus Pacearchaeota archaeon]|nr:DNA-binding protein Alba [Candidatus Pacearchaeota archaeon]